MTAQPAEPDPPGNPQLGALIREQIARRRLTIDGLARTLGVHRSTLSRWLMGGVCPSPAHLTALEEALGVRFVEDGTGRFQAVDPALEPDPAPAPPVMILSTAEAVEAAFKWLGVPRVE